MAAAVPQNRRSGWACFFFTEVFAEVKSEKRGAEFIAIELIKQNVQAVRMVNETLAQHGTAAIIRPTGAGKGRAAWELLQERAGQTVFWLTPNETKKTLRQAEFQRWGGTQPESLHVWSCEQLEQADAEMWVRLAQQRPELLVVDGWREWTAMQWKWCIQRLRRLCPKAQVLGLASPDHSADNWEAETLFRDSVAETESLAQALAKEQLPMPVQVTPLLWPLEPAQENFRAQGKNLRTEGQQDPSKAYFTAFSHAVEKAAGVPQEKLRALPQGRYFVLCETETAQVRFQENFQPLFGENASLINKKEKETAEQAAGSVQLMTAVRGTIAPLPGMAGAVLVRETADPQVYRQMLSIALQVCGGVPVVELNACAEGLSSVLALRREYEKESGKSFPAEEPMQAVFRAARQLQRSLDMQWEAYYAEAKAAAAEGDLNALPRSEQRNGLALGRWLEIQRQVRAGERLGRLTAEQAVRLEKLGLVWKQRLEQAWERGFRSAQQYRRTHPDLMVPVRCHDKNGFALGEWIVYNRQRYLGKNLSAERIERLQALGMVWDIAMALWNQSYAVAVQYFLEHHSLEVPVKYVAPDGLALGVWLGSQRTAYKEKTLCKEQIEQLEALGIDWVNRNDRKWQSAYEAAVRYHAAHGDLNVPSEYVDPDGVLLGKWVSRQRYAWQNPERSSAKLTPERKARLDALGMVWEKADSWENRYALAMAYKQEHGSLEIPAQYRTEEGIWLGSWVSRQRQLYHRDDKTLSAERRKALRQLFKGEPQRRSSASHRQRYTLREQNWYNNYRRARVYAKRRGDLLVPASYVDETGFRLGVWISNLRAARKMRPDSFQVTPEHIALLDEIGMQWDAREAKWQCALRRAEEYGKEHGDLRVPVNYKTADGFCLGDWVRRMRESYAAKDAKLTPERVARLDALGMVWDLSEE